MTELGSQARALLAAARDGLGPDPAAIARMRSAIANATAPAAAATTAAGSAVGKLVVIAAIAAVGAGALGLALRPRPVAATAVRLDDPAPTAAPPVLITTRFALAAHDEPPPAPAAVPAVTRAVAPPPSLAQEIALLDRAMGALRAGQPAAALRVVHDYAWITAHHGQMAEEAAAIELEAGCATGAPDAALARRWPHAADRPRVRAACSAR